MPLAAFLKEGTEERLFLSQVERPLVDRKNKPFGNLLPFEMQVIIIFWTQCFMTNDRRKKMNEELTRLPCCLRTAIPMSVAFSFSSGYKRFSSATEKKNLILAFTVVLTVSDEKPSDTQYVWTFVLFRNSFALCFRGLVGHLVYVNDYFTILYLQAIFLKHTFSSRLIWLWQRTSMKRNSTMLESLSF